MAIVIRMNILNKDDRKQLTSLMAEYGIEVLVQTQDQETYGVKQESKIVYMRFDDEEMYYNDDD